MFTIGLALSWTLNLGAAGPLETSPAGGPVDELVRQFEQDRSDHRQRMRQASGAEREALREQAPHESDYIDRFLAIEAEHRGEDEGCRALLWILIDAYDLSALERLIPRYVESPLLEELCFHLAHFMTDESFAALAAIAENSPHRNIAGPATFVLASNLKRSVDLGFEIEEPARIEKLFEKVLADYADLDDTNGGTLGAGAERALYEYRNLSVGCIAPEIDGKDLEGAGIRLSDYRGKVVVLTFWGHWCPPCRDMFEHEKDLVERLMHEPFAIVGVNSDANLERAIELSDEAGINWRSFWNGPRGNRGPISRDWNVEGWPSLYLLDHEGRIAEKWRGDPGDVLEERVAELIAAAKKTG